MFLMIGIVQFIASILQGIAFAYCAEVLVRRVRKSTFGSLLRQDMAYFDQPQNSVGALSAFLAVETMQVTGISGSTLGTILTSVTNIVAGIAVSLAIGWKLALVCFSMVPLVLACGFFRYFMLYRYQNRAGAAYASSAAFAVEHISSMRTIASLTLEDKVSSEYEAAIAKQQTESLKSVAKSSCLYSASHSVTFLCIGLGFWYGSTLMATAEYTIFQFFVCLMAIVFGAQAAGTFFTFIPEIVKAKHSANQLKKLFDTKPVIDTWDSQGRTLATVEGRLEFRNVYFRYPTRPERPVLRGIDITVEPGQHVALVGASGCGKSTTVSLLERFYDPIVGQILIDGHDISELQVNDYRSHLALVNQEPTLYQGTIRENICYGSRLEDVAEEVIVQASRDANIYDFIVSLPDGFDSLVGVGGALLSGGQKQRIAIARALIRSPKILLLDEATSALDSESESIVQAALDRAAEGRTTVTIAHRLSSIQHADKIYVIDQGRIAESGTHSQLMEQNGRYAELVELQSMS
jgi:ATP-binding cassette subfamily B (MDR/TAP) protein 1